MRRWYNEGINSWKAMIFSWRHIYWNFLWFRNIVFLKRPGLLWYGYRVVCGLMEVQHDVLRAQRNCWSYFHFPDLSKPWKRMWHEWHKEQMKRACNKISVFSGNITSFLYVFPKLYFVWPVHPRTSTLRKKKKIYIQAKTSGLISTCHSGRPKKCKTDDVWGFIKRSDRKYK